MLKVHFSCFTCFSPGYDQRHSFKVRISFGKFFSSMALHDVIKGGIACMGASVGRVCTHHPGVYFPKASLAESQVLSFPA